MKTEVNYLGLRLNNPLIASASPFSMHPDLCKKLEDNGISAIVMHSLFEEEINQEIHEVDQMLFNGRDSFSEALDFFPESSFENYETENYLKRVRQLKESLEIPVIASLNGVSSGGWVKYARSLEEAGADALELNLYYPADNPDATAAQIEESYLETIRTVKENCSLPVAVKLAPYFTVLPNFLRRARERGADAAVLFNRFYQPDIDLEELEWISRLYPSSEVDLGKVLRALAVNFNKSDLQFCASGGVKTGTDIVKAVMAGASTVAVATVLYERGVEHASAMLREALEWMQEHEYESYDQMRGSISYERSPNPSALERANYVEILRRGDELWGL